MLDRPVVAFDIETIPDPDIGRNVQGFSGNDADVIHQMVRLRLEETDGSTEYPQLPWHRVVCVCATILNYRTGTAEIRCLGGDALDERSHIEGFFRLVCAELEDPRLVSWNGNGFDLPVLRYRSLKLGIAAPGFYRTDGPWLSNNYQNRFHDMHVDVMDVLSGYGASRRVGLATAGQLLGRSAKSFLDHEVYKHLLAGDAQRVVEYCKHDTLETMLVFLVWAFHSGALTKDELQKWVEAVRASVARESFEGWRGVEMSLRAWPPWL